MIVAVCADKGSPGVTTLALALGLVWPGDRLVLEADPSGADLPLRLERAGGGPLEHQPNVLSLAADARIGLPAGSLSRYAQETTLGVSVIPGALSAEAFVPMRALWPAVAGEAARWHGTVIADLGRLQPGHSAQPIAQAATAVVLLARPSLEGLYHLRDRVYELVHLLGGQRHNHPDHPDHPDRRTGEDRLRTPVTVAVLSPPKREAEGVAQVNGMLEGMGAPVRVAGAISDDPRTVQALYAARLDRRAPRTPLLSSVAALTGALIRAYPELNPAHHVRDVDGIRDVDDGQPPPAAHDSARDANTGQPGGLGTPGGVGGGGLPRGAAEGWSAVQAPGRHGARP